MKPTVEEFNEFLAGIQIMDGYSKDVYLTRYCGCIPEGYISEEISQDIIEKFKLPLQFVIKVIESEGLLKGGQYLYAMVEPSYEDSTHSIVYIHATSRPIMRIVYDDWTKAWNYWFESKKEFEKHLKALHDIIVKNIKG